jgi:hypothetical protein
LIVPTVNKWYEFDVTDYVKTTFNSGPEKEITFVLKQDEGQTGSPLLAFRSRESFTTIALQVTWSTSATPSPSPTPTPSPTFTPSSTGYPTAPGTDLTLNPIADSFVNLNEPDSNFGGSPYLRTWSLSETYGFGYRSYLKFDLSGIPSAATVESAKLELYTAYRMGDETSKVEVHFCDDNTWTELGITWNNAPSFDSASSYTNSEVAFDGTWYSWVLTEDVIRARPNQQLSLVLASSSSTIENFYSKDPSYAEEYKPKLTITYSGVESSPSPNPTATPTPTSTSTPSPNPTPTEAPTPTPKQRDGLVLSTTFYITLTIALFTIIGLIVFAYILRRK